jgi:hypothetical protein
MVSKRERELLGRVPPWCLPRDAFLKVCAVVPRTYYARMHLYYEFYGCLSCGTREEGGYCSCGMCQRCVLRLEGRLKRCGRVLARRESEGVEPARVELVNRIRSARKILADLRPRSKSAGQGPLSSGAVPRVVTLGLEGRGARRRMP